MNNVNKTTGEVGIAISLGPTPDGGGVLLTIRLGAGAIFQIAMPWEAVPSLEQALRDAREKRPRIVVARPNGVSS